MDCERPKLSTSSRGMLCFMLMGSVLMYSGNYQNNKGCAESSMQNGCWLTRSMMKLILRICFLKPYTAIVLPATKIITSGAPTSNTSTAFGGKYPGVAKRLFQSELTLSPRFLLDKGFFLPLGQSLKYLSPSLKKDFGFLSSICKTTSIFTRGVKASTDGI